MPPSKPYKLADDGSLALDPHNLSAGLLGAFKDGLVDDDTLKTLLPKAQAAEQAAKDTADLQARVGADQFAKGKAFLTGAGRGGAFLAGALPAGAAAAEAALPLDPATFGGASLVAGAVGALAGGFASQHAASAIGDQLAKHNDTIKSFADASKALPGYDAAGNLVSMVVPGAAGLANLGRVTAIRAAEEGLPAALKLGAKEAGSQALAGAAFEGAIRPAFDYVVNQGKAALGITPQAEEVQTPTAKSVLTNAVLGVALGNLGTKFENFSHEQIGDIFSRATNAETAGIPMGDVLSPREQEVFKAAQAKAEQMRQSGNTFVADPAKFRTEVQQAYQRGLRGQDTVRAQSVNVEGAGPQPGPTVLEDAARPPQRGGQTLPQLPASPTDDVPAPVEPPQSGSPTPQIPGPNPPVSSGESPAVQPPAVPPESGSSPASSSSPSIPGAPTGQAQPSAPEAGDTLVHQGARYTITGGDADTISLRPASAPADAPALSFPRSLVEGQLSGGQAQLEKAAPAAAVPGTQTPTPADASPAAPTPTAPRPDGQANPPPPPAGGRSDQSPANGAQPEGTTVTAAGQSPVSIDETQNPNTQEGSSDERTPATTQESQQGGTQGAPADRGVSPAESGGPRLAEQQQRRRPRDLRERVALAERAELAAGNEHLAAAQDFHAAEIAHHGATFAPGTGDNHSGISLAPDSAKAPVIRHAPTAFARSAQAVKEAGGNPREWAKSAVGEELIHHRDVVASGTRFDATHQAIYDSLSKPQREAVAEAYPDNLHPVVQAAEYLRMLSQQRAGQPVTESHFRDTSKLESILAGPQPKAVEDHLAKMERLAPSQSAPPATLPAGQNTASAHQTGAATSPSAPTIPGLPPHATGRDKEDRVAPSTDYAAIAQERQAKGDLAVAQSVGLTQANVLDFENGTNETGINPQRFGQDGLTLEVQRRRQEAVAGGSAPAQPTPTTPPPAQTPGSTEVPATSADQTPAPAKKQRSFSLPEAPTGTPDALDRIKENGRIVSRTEAQKREGFTRYAGDYDGAPDLKGIHNASVYGGKLMPDRMAKILHEEYGIGDGSPDGMWSAISQAVSLRQKVKAQYQKNAQKETQASRFSRDTARKGKGKKGIHAGNLAVGDVLTVTDQKMKVIDVDPDTLDVTLEDHSKYGVQQVEDGQVLYVEKVRKAQTAKDGQGFDPAPTDHPADRLPETPRAQTSASVREAAGPSAEAPREAPSPQPTQPAPDFNLESVTGDQLDAEREKARVKRELEERKNKRLSGKDLDTTGDMLDPLAADNPLFANAKPVDTKAPKISDAASKALDDAFGGLFAANPVAAAPTLAQEELPPDKIGPFVTAAQALITSGIDTPEAMARVLDDKFQGKARKYSEALWDAFGMANKALRGTHDWTSIYGKLDAASNPPQDKAAQNSVAGQIPMPEKSGAVATPLSSPSSTPSADDLPSRPHLEPDRPDAGPANGSREGGVSPNAEPNRADGEPVAEAGDAGRDTAEGGPLSADVPSAPHGERGDSGVRERAPGTAQRPAGDQRPAGSRGPDDAGLSPEPRGPNELALSLDGPANVAQTLAGSGELGAQSGQPERAEVQLGRWHKSLTPEQVGDGQFVERRLFGANKPGVLITNGTGTGKTFSGLGVIKRLLDAGENHILVAVPSDKIAGDWVDTAKRFFDIPDAAQLESTKDPGAEYRVAVTTYANLAQNHSLVSRPWAMVVADEAHYLSQAQDGKSTEALSAFRALTLHPKGAYRRAEMMEPEARAAIDRLVQLHRAGTKWTPEQEGEHKASSAKLDAASEKVEAEMAKRGEAGRPKALLVSATPFAYHFSLDYAEGYLFDHGPEPKDRGYNTPSARGQFYMDNFGYRMRTGKLTAPENATATGILERRFAEKLMKDGAMSGRALTVPHDYGREFVLTESALGSKIDEIMTAMHNDATLRPLLKYMGVGDYLQRRFLLESLKARDSVPRIQAHLALGRKVVVFHDYKKGGAVNPLRSTHSPGMTEFVQDGRGGVNVNLDQAYRALSAKVSGFDDAVAQLNALQSPLDLFRAEFPQAAVFNGDVSKGDRRKAVEAFNASGGPTNVILVQRASGKEGISLHDRDGKHQRVFMDLGIPGRPTDAIQSEGRIYRHGVKSNAVMEYLTTGTNFERWTFAQTIAQRASTAENLAMGERARNLLQSFASGYNDAAPSVPSKEQGAGGKQVDAALENGDPYKNAVALYYTNAKKTARTKSQEGVDYFPTPEPLAFKMVEWANIRPGEKVLEPSAGHGAIARFFPDSTNRHAVESSNELAGRLALNATDTEIHQQRFEDYHVSNKFDAIVMNPPFGTAGRTAVDHLAKAALHLREGGRIVALLPEGSATDKFNRWLDGAEGIYQSAEFGLPPVTFERAGTAVKARVVVLDKVSKPENAPQQQGRRDIGADTITEFFDALANVSTSPRSAQESSQSGVSDAGSPVRQSAPPKGLSSVAVGSSPTSTTTPRPARGFTYGDTFKAPDGKQGVMRGLGGMGSDRVRLDDPATGKTFGYYNRSELTPIRQNGEAEGTLPTPTRDSNFSPADFRHTQSRTPIFVAKPERHFSEMEYKQQAVRARLLGGHYSAFKGAGAIPGFHFKTAEARDAFIGGRGQELRAASPSAIAARSRAQVITKDEGYHELRAENATVAGPATFNLRAANPLVAYHGTPHEVDRFSNERIGTGEGSQVYGHGLYFAEHPDVANTYATKLSSPNERSQAAYKDLAAALRKDDLLGFDSVREAVDGVTNSPNWRKAWEMSSETVQAFERYFSTRGNRYQVHLDAEPHELLDWDKPLAEQGPIVRAAVNKIMDLRDADRERFASLWDGTAQRIREGAMSGEGFYRRISQPNIRKAADPKAASQMLLEAGLPGLRYLDQGSRSAGNGTRNYVMFDDSRIKITHRNGEPVTMAEATSTAPALHAANPLQGFRNFYDQAADEIASMDLKDRIKGGYDAANNMAEDQGEKVATSIRLDLPEKQDREAMPFVIEAGGDPGKVQAMRAKVAASKDPKLAAKYLPLVDHAMANFPRLQKARANHDRIMARSLAQLRAAGVDVGEVENYVTRKLDRPDTVKDILPNPIFGMGGGATGGPRYFAKGRAFETLADAIEAGYPPKGTDLADLDKHRIVAARRILEQKAFVNRLKGTLSPTDGKPIVGKFGTRTPLSGETERTTPDGYTAVRTTAGEVPIHNQFAHLFQDLYGDSAARRVALFRAMLKAAAISKSYTLVGDSFHVGRLLFKMAAGGGGAPVTFRNGKPQWNIRQGLALIQYGDEDLDRAVTAGDITQAEADYARRFRPQHEELLAAGLNVGRVADNLVQQARVHIPGLQGMNDWIFGKLSRAAMLQTALTNYQRNLTNFPDRTQQENARQTAKEMNELFGNLQNQGLFTNKTFQDLTRLVFLAPQWTESQFRYEGRAYGQFFRAGYSAIRGGGSGKGGGPGSGKGKGPGGTDLPDRPGSGLPGKRFRLGNAARVMATGLAALFAANQVINWLSRGQFTWQNKEDDHQLDAFIPGGKRGFWFNPFEIAGEYAHAAFKYAAQHQNPVDVATQIASNKLSPLARGAKDILTGRDYAGRHFLSDADRFRAGAVDALPSPIPFGGALEKDPRAPLGYRLNRQPGSFEKQFLSSIGAKVTNAQSARTQMFALAQPFRADRGANDAAGEYTELRRALDNDDERGSQSEIRWLLERGKSMNAISHAVGIQQGAGGYSVKPETFTGSADQERAFKASLSPEHLELYNQAQADHVANAQKFVGYAKDLLQNDPEAKKLAGINGAGETAKKTANKAAAVQAKAAGASVPKVQFAGF